MVAVKLRHPVLLPPVLWLVWASGTAMVVYGFVAHRWATNLLLSLNYVGALILGGSVFIICIFSSRIPTKRAIRGLWFALFYLAYGIFIAISSDLTNTQFTAAFALMNIWLIALVITGRQFWPKTGR